LRQQLWPEGTYVDFDGGLNVILKKLRAALDDDSDNPLFIETVPRHGYRFIAPVTVESVQQSAGERPRTALPARRGHARRPQAAEAGSGIEAF
jgi:DNA-binding winged helix-turn-helix (wHTH) protein